MCTRRCFSKISPGSCQILFTTGPHANASDSHSRSNPYGCACPKLTWEAKCKPQCRRLQGSHPLDRLPCSLIEDHAAITSAARGLMVVRVVAIQRLPVLAQLPPFSPSRQPPDSNRLYSGSSSPEPPDTISVPLGPITGFLCMTEV